MCPSEAEAIFAIPPKFYVNWHPQYRVGTLNFNSVWSLTFNHLYEIALKVDALLMKFLFNDKFCYYFKNCHNSLTTSNYTSHTGLGEAGPDEAGLGSQLCDSARLPEPPHPVSTIG